MTRTQGKNLIIDYGDFGVITPITITNVLETDVIKFRIFNKNEKIIEKELPFVNGKWELQLTEEDSNSLKMGEYLYEIVQYRDGILKNTINKGSSFKVE